ncbi:HNH endonuclease [Streptomyces phage Bing]|uniref:HNH endonuclease n=1 Tax=Streptomyces phage Bing TaxID=2079427 RepID=A0A2L1IW69_9CAUD|nr:HNH endonuclease [Streptomyces phage Bing]AVD99424.1 HNH endonuclease [Streptomyces phage Bing]
MSRSYSELRQLETFVERFRYLALRGSVGQSTFGFDRWVNQGFYTSREWRQARDGIIVRDNGCDLGLDGYEIHHGLYIHHLNPITLEQLEDGDDCLLDPNNLITVTHRTHNAIHYGDEKQLVQPVVDRRPGDTKLW